MSNVDVSLTTANAATDQARAGILVIQGTLTGNVNIVVPTQSKSYAVLNQATGAYNVVIKNASGTGVTLPASGTEIVICTSATCAGLIGSFNFRVTE